MEFNKKAISPVVATALLLVVAVVAVVGFQTWFNTYQSGLNSKIEQQSNTGSAITIERFELVGSNGNVYFKNSGSKQVDILTINIKSKSSTGTGSCTSAPYNVTTNQVGNKTLSCSGFVSGEIASIVAVTNDGVFSAEKIVR